MIPSERLKLIQELAASTRRQEQELKAVAPLRPLTEFLYRARLIELRGWLMDSIEIAALRALEREDEKDQDDYKRGDWTA